MKSMLNIDQLYIFNSIIKIECLITGIAIAIILYLMEKYYEDETNFNLKDYKLSLVYIVFYTLFLIFGPSDSLLTELILKYF